MTAPRDVLARAFRANALDLIAGSPQDREEAMTRILAAVHQYMATAATAAAETAEGPSAPDGEGGPAQVRDGNAVAEYILGPACRFVRLPVPVTTASAGDDPWRPAITASADPDDDPDDYVAHLAACRNEFCDGECTERPF